MTMKAAALIEYEKRERQLEAERMEHEQQACEEAIRDAYRTFRDREGNGYFAESAVYNRGERRVELGFDNGTVKIAREYQSVGEWDWRVLHECPDCGVLVAGQAVNDLADIGKALKEGLPAVNDHYCLSEYMAEPKAVTA